MSRSILRKDHIETRGMEGETASKEPFLQIDTIWNGGRKSYETVEVKEENLSDVEQEDLCKDRSRVSCSSASCEKHRSNVTGKRNTEPMSIFKDSAALMVKDALQLQLVPKGIIDNTNCPHNSRNFKVIKKRVRCSDCKAMLCPECFNSINSTLQSHFSKSDNNNRYLYPCKMCSMVFKSNCALQAHIRIHLLDTPYVCPDCGAVYSNIYFLSLHLINKCYHVYKIIKNGCKFCLSQNMAPKDYISHIEQAHIKPIFKCSQCGLMFENSADINCHLEASHKNENVSPLSYFCCSMCGNLIISKQIYAKHIKYHQEYSAAFQIGYLCACGETHNTATSFRTHFKNCSEKGVLPPQWTYLHVTLKSHEMLQFQSAAVRNTCARPEPVQTSNASDSNNRAAIEQRKTNLKPFQVSDKRDGVDVLKETGKDNSNDNSVHNLPNDENKNEEIEKADFCTCSSKTLDNDVTETPDKNDEAQENREMTVPEDISEKSVDDQEKESENREKDYLEATRLTQDEEKEKPSGDDNTVNENLYTVPNTQPAEELSTEPRTENDSQVMQETDKEEEDIVETGRICEKNLTMYGHIPCDHLGYLKIQEHAESEEKEVAQTSTFHQTTHSTEPVSDNYVITSVLDEKTGFMRTKKVLVQKNQAENVDSDCCIINPPSCVINPPSCIEASFNIPPQEIQQPKSSTFFSCPFCTVLFPKHPSSFDRFRLHMGRYHPDAGLDITIDRSETPKSKAQFTSISRDDYSDSDDSRDLDNVDLQTRLSSLNDVHNKDSAGKNNPQKNRHKQQGGKRKKKGGSSSKSKSRRRRAGRRELEMKLRSSDKDAQGEKPENGSENSNEIGTKPAESGDENLLSRKTGENSGSPVKPVDQSVTHSKNTHLDKQKDEQKVIRPGSNENGTKVASNEQVVSSTSLGNFRDEDNSESLDSENSMQNSESSKDHGEIMFKLNKSVAAEKSRTLHRKQVSILNHKSKRMCENTFFSYSSSNELREEDDESTGRLIIDSEHESPENSLTGNQEKEHCCKNSRSRSKTPTEEMPSESRDPEQSDKIYLRGRSVERRNSRRESDVWSDFYKTLKLAETLKKTKADSQDNYEKDEASVSTNYANKRVVKKPKRYRGSSNSEESEDGKQSPNSSKSFDSKPDHDDEEMYIKKKKLLRRLENADGKVLDYLLNLLEKKEENDTSTKKSPEGSMKSYRKKLPSGQKMPGKQLKSSKDTECNDTESGMKDDVYEFEVELELQNGTSDDKSVDKKKGRPKKPDNLMLKERRRSDVEREVRFFEKNFDSEENDYFGSKRKRRLSSKLQFYKKMGSSPEENDFSSGQVIRNKPSESEKRFTCAVCKENYEKEPEFKEHIRSHRMDDNSHQCMECGECFVVRPSLEKHLHAFHKVKDVEKYIKENECSTVDKYDEQDADEPLGENQCRVCKDEFKNSRELNKHFRIHGMAFLEQFKKDQKTQ